MESVGQVDCLTKTAENYCSIVRGGECSIKNQDSPIFSFFNFRVVRVLFLSEIVRLVASIFLQGYKGSCQVPICMLLCFTNGI